VLDGVDAVAALDALTQRSHSAGDT
jgi:hypothetical protein